MVEQQDAIQTDPSPVTDINPRGDAFNKELEANSPWKKSEEAAPATETPADANPASDTSVDSRPGAETAKPARDPATGKFAQGKDKRDPEYVAKTEQRFGELLESNRQLKAQLDALTAQQTRASQPDAGRQVEKPAEPAARPVRPTWEKFDGTWDQFEAAVDAYNEALAEWKADQKLSAYRAANEEKAQKLYQEAQQTKELRHFAELRSQAEKEHPDFTEISGKAYEAIVASDNAGFSILPDWGIDGNRVLYHLGKNPDLMKQIAAMPPADAITELAVLRRSLASGNGAQPHTPPVKKTVTSAPPPETRLSGTKVSPTDPFAAAVASGDTDAAIRLERERMSAGRRR